MIGSDVPTSGKGRTGTDSLPGRPSRLVVSGPCRDRSRRRTWRSCWRRRALRQRRRAQVDRGAAGAAGSRVGTVRRYRRASVASRPSGRGRPRPRSAAERLSKLHAAGAARQAEAHWGPDRRLLAYLLDRVGDSVPLLELLAVNAFHSATPRRLRELRWEHGGWPIESYGSGFETRYLLQSADPDLGASAYYWLKRNIRQSDLAWDARLVALLSARLGEPVPLEDLEYVLPRGSSSGRGRARTAPAGLTRRIRDLRARGYQVQSGVERTHAGLGSSEYVMPSLERLPEYERFPAKVRDARLALDGYRCAQCGWSPSLRSRAGTEAARGAPPGSAEIARRSRPRHRQPLHVVQRLPRREVSVRCSQRGGGRRVRHRRVEGCDDGLGDPPREQRRHGVADLLRDRVID